MSNFGHDVCAARIQKLEGALRAAKREHEHSDDPWGSCRKDPERIDFFHEDDLECDCGADAHNAAIDAALAEDTKVTPTGGWDDGNYGWGGGFQDG